MKFQALNYSLRFIQGAKMKINNYKVVTELLQLD